MGRTCITGWYHSRVRLVTGLGLVAALCAVALPVCAQESGITNSEKPESYKEELKQNIKSLSPEEAEAYIARALETNGAGTAIGTHITGNLPVPVFQHQKEFNVEVRDLQFFPASGRFVTTLTFVGSPDDIEGTVLGALNVQGSYAEYVRVPVMKKRVPIGSTIQASDIRWVSVPKDKLRRDTITRSESLIGQSAAHSLAEGRPLRADEVRAPIVVPRGGEVTLIYRRPYLELRALGVSLQDGSIGDTVSVRNKDSNKVVQGIVEDATTVQVISVGTMPVGEGNGRMQ